MTVMTTDLSEHTTDEVLAHLFTSVVDEMAWILVRSAYTTFVKESQDFATALVSTSGEIFAYPRSAGVTSLVGSPMQEGINAFDDWAEGDVLITNDPYATRGMVTHLNDIYMLKPVFADGELVCFAFAFIHCTDVGGAAPGSIDMRHHEVFQEGLRLRPVKLYKRGVFNEELWNVLYDNSRIPTLNRGDINALVAAVDKAEQRIHGLVAKHGKEAFLRAIDRTLDHTETLTRAILARIPAGRYTFSEYFEDDYVSDIPVKLQVCLHARGDGTVELDFTGTDPQVQSALNMPIGGQKHHPFLSRTFLNYIVTQEPTISWNAGMLRCIDLVLPEASVVNCEFPASCGMRATTSIRLHDAVLGCLMQAVPDIVPAGGASQVAVTYVSIGGAGTRGRVVSANPVQGGSGGSAAIDGLSGSDRPLAYLRNVPAEILEFEGPVIVHRFGLVPDSEGAGMNRGGFGVEFVLELRHPEAVLVIRGKDRHRFSAWGAKGGRAGTTCTNYGQLPGEKEPRYLGKATVYRPQFGEIVTLRGGGGGGYGDPFERDPAKVLADVEAGLVSLERARDVYGVAIVDGKVDEAETAKLRAVDRGPLPEFDYGPGRTEWAAAYEVAADTIRDWLWTLPKSLRNYAKQDVWARMRRAGDPPYSEADAKAAIDDATAVLRERGLL